MAFFDSVAFWVFAIAATLAALSVVFNRSVVYAALSLIVVFFSIAGLFVLNNADFLAVAQAIVYGVGLTIVILFGIMFTGDRLIQDRVIGKPQLLAYFVVAALTFAVLLPVGFHQYGVVPTPPILAAMLYNQGSTPLLGWALFNQYALPFEAASVLLLIAMVGAIVISKKSFAPQLGGGIKYSASESALPDDADKALHTSIDSVNEHARHQMDEAFKQEQHDAEVKA